MGQSSTADVYASAEANFLAGKFEAAHLQLEAALNADDDAGQLWELLGMVAYAEGDPDLAIDALEHASLLVPLANCSQFVLAICYEKREQPESASSIYRHLGSQDDLDENLMEPVARALGRCDECEYALEVCRLAATRMPEAPEPLMGMVFYMKRLSRPAEQILPVLFRAFHLDPEDSDCRLTLARTLHECQQHEEAAYLLSVLPIEDYRCMNCLTAMHEIFAAAGDATNLARCIAVLQAIEGRKA